MSTPDPAWWSPLWTGSDAIVTADEPRAARGGVVKVVDTADARDQVEILLAHVDACDDALDAARAELDAIGEMLFTLFPPAAGYPRS